MKRLLYISRYRIDEKSHSGLSVESSMQYKAVKSIWGDNCDLYTLPDAVANKRFDVESIIYHRYADMRRVYEAQILDLINAGGYDIVYLDNSLWGYLVEKISHLCKCSTVIFCQDIEYHRLNTLLKSEWTRRKYCRYIWHSYLYYIGKKNERKAVQNANYILTFNSRDSSMLSKVYGRTSDGEIPVCLEDDDINEITLDQKPLIDINKINLLFVGALDYLPNIEAVLFMIKAVMPYVKEDVCLNIVGKSGDRLKINLENDKRVNIIGEVPELRSYYEMCDAVVLPLFSGGGMKVKTAEALKYGKTLLGTKEAFEGYPVDYEQVGGLCNTSDEFIKAINQLEKQKKNEYSRSFFEEHCSFSVMVDAYNTFFRRLS